MGVKTVSYEPEPVHTNESGDMIPQPTAADVSAAPVPTDAAADARRAEAEAMIASQDAHEYHNEAVALTDEAKDDATLSQDAHHVQVDEAERMRHRPQSNPSTPSTRIRPSTRPSLRTIRRSPSTELRRPNAQAAS